MGRCARTALTLVVVLAACTSSSAPGDVAPPVATATDAPPSDQRFPDVAGAAASETDNGWTFDVTISSPYDTPARYADAWRVIDAEGIVFGVRELTHDHAAEQPFTRTLSAVAIPDDVQVVTIEARDSANGWGGQTIDVQLR